eukprot:scaffold22774_cov55-Attheya_sp.AAC.6
MARVRCQTRLGASPVLVHPVDSADADADTVAIGNLGPDAKKLRADNTAAKNGEAKLSIQQLEKDLRKSKDDLHKEKGVKRKLYSSLVKLATELKTTKNQVGELQDQQNYASRTWYEGGMWREPSLLPGLAAQPFDGPPTRSVRDAVSLSDLFLDLVVVTAFTRVGIAVTNRGTIDGPVLAYFALFWNIWGKESSYTTRFDSTDLSAQVESLLTCFAVLFGSLSTTAEGFGSSSSTPARSKRGVLFILLLGFLLQSVVIAASSFFDYISPTLEQYMFLGGACFLLYLIKLLYVDDSYSIDPQDHALLINQVAGFFFSVGQFVLLLSTTVLGAGLDLLTHSYLAAIASLPDNARNLVCGGFAGVIVSIALIKSMHIRRIPNNPQHQRLFFMAYGSQTIVLLGISYISIRMCYSPDGYLSYIMKDEITMLFFLCGAAFLLLMMSWLDEGVELSLYGSATNASEYRVHPFGLWWCLKPAYEGPTVAEMAEAAPDQRLAQLSPLLGSSVQSLQSMRSLRNIRYNAISGDVTTQAEV